MARCFCSPHPVVVFRAVALFFLGSLLFTLTYAQAPLYFSNQNQYFLHGLAAAGYGSLDRDWLANTADPAPLFSLLVEGTYHFGGENSFYVYYALLMGVYLISLVSLFDLVGERRGVSPPVTALFLALVLLVHSALLRSLSARLFGVDYPWYFQAGLAGQYVLGPMLQPSCFGVLLLLSLVLFGRGRPFLAVACSSLGAVCHSTYLLPAALLTISYLTLLLWERQVWKALWVAVCALVLVAPAVAYILATFRPSSPEAFAEAQRLLVHFRLPHHCLPALWFDPIAAAQVVWLLLGIALARSTRLFPVLLIAFLLAAALTLLQVATSSDTLALLFPWRISVILMPAATAIILTRLVLWAAAFFRESAAVTKLAWAASGVIAVVVVAGGIAIMVFHWGFQERNEELAMLQFVRDHQRPGDLYLLPIEIPNLKATVRGSAKSDFVPLPSVQKGGQFIKVDLQRFRLITGAPIFVDFKSIPYADQDVIEWHHRLLLTQEIYADLDAGHFAQTAVNLRQHGITHLVLKATQKNLEAVPFALVYAGPYYRIYLVPAK